VLLQGASNERVDEAIATWSARAATETRTLDFARDR
jgi:flavin-binding protein dodecin